MATIGSIAAEQERRFEIKQRIYVAVWLAVGTLCADYGISPQDEEIDDAKHKLVNLLSERAIKGRNR